MEDNEIIIRNATDSDRSQLIELWRDHSDWGEISEVQFVKWFVNQPYGKAIIIVAQDLSGDVIGQIVFTPVNISVQNEVFLAARVAAPVIKANPKPKALLSFDHVVLKMYDFGLEYLKQKGFEMVYTFPAKGWLQFIKYIGKTKWKEYFNQVIPCYQIPWNHQLPNDYVKSWNDYVVKLIERFDYSFDDLWTEGVKTLPVACGIIRNSKWLSWKIGGHVVIGIYKNNHSDKLIGYIAFNKKSGLVVDIFARTVFELEMTLFQGIAYFKNLHVIHGNQPLDHFSFMWSENYKKIQLLEFTERSKFEFAFSCTLLTKNIPKSKIHPSNWYMMPND